MKKIKFKDIINLSVAINKLYNVSDLHPEVKEKVYLLVKKIRDEEKIFLRMKDSVVNMNVERDNSGKPLTAIKKMNGVDFEYYIFKDQEKYLKDMTPILETDVNFAAECLDIPISGVCNTPLTVKDIDMLVVHGILIERNDNHGKIEVIKNRLHN